MKISHHIYSGMFLATSLISFGASIFNIRRNAFIAYLILGAATLIGCIAIEDSNN